MRYTSFRRPGGEASFGRLDGKGGIVDLGGPSGGSLGDALRAGDLDQRPAGATLTLADVVLLPLINDPGKIICVGLNYATHVAETGREQKEHPTIFTRWADTLVADGQPLVLPRASSDFDYEGELAVVIGKGGRAISVDRALAHVAGYSIFNDASVRDWQKHNIQFTPGKNFPGTGAFGPALVTPDEVPNLASQRVVTRLNGTVVQDQPVSDMIWGIAEIIAYVSAFTPLNPGDVIATGTPGGVGAKRNPPLWMKAGDLVEIEIGVLGTLTNRIIDEQ